MNQLHHIFTSCVLLHFISKEDEVTVLAPGSGSSALSTNQMSSKSALILLILYSKVFPLSFEARLGMEPQPLTGCMMLQQD